VHIHISINLVRHSYRKLNMKIYKVLIIQKHDVKQFCVSGFAIALKTDDFDGTFYNNNVVNDLLVDKSEWLSCHIGKTEKFTPNEQKSIQGCL
jgi:hypothetical protein